MARSFFPRPFLACHVSLYAIRTYFMTPRLSARPTYLCFLFAGAPIPPMTVKTTSCANYSTNLTWTVFLHPDLPPPVSFIIERAFKQQSYGLPISSYSKLAEVSASTRSYVVNNLEPHHEFSFRIRARNQMGVGFPRISAFPSCATNSKSKYPKIKQLGYSLDL